jgi:hypothetical protein
MWNKTIKVAKKAKAGGTHANLLIKRKREIYPLVIESVYGKRPEGFLPDKYCLVMLNLRDGVSSRVDNAFFITCSSRRPSRSILEGGRRR